MSYLGDFALAVTLDNKFTTRSFSTGVPGTLASGAISIYKDNSVTQSTSGVTLSADFDSVTGLNNVRIDLSSDGTFYSAGSNFDAVITTGTVGGVSVVGEVIFSFSITNRSGLRPTTAGRTLDVSAGGEAGVDWANVGSPTTTLNLSGTSTLALEPTTAGRKLDVTTTGEAGIDWANIGAPTTANVLSGTTVGTATTCTDLTAARAEPGQGTPAVNGSVMAKVDYLFKNWRNRKAQTATTWSLYNDDAATVDQKATVSDDGTTAGKTEVATGP